MCFFKLITCIVVFFSLAGNGVAQPMLQSEKNKSEITKKIHVKIFLESIEVKKLSEKAGDELYLNVTEYSSSGASRDYRIPNKPLHWLSRELSQIKNLEVWEGDVQQDEELKVILSVVEEDALWDPDDLIGSAQITLTNQQGQLEKRWGVPVFEERVETVLETDKKSKETKDVINKKTNQQQFIMKGDHSLYRVTFSLSE